MKKVFRRSHGILCGLVVALAAVILAVTLSGCKSTKPKTFEKAGMSITLTTDFTEKSLISQTAYYESKDAIVTVLKEEFTLLEGSSSWTVSRYADVVIGNNMLNTQKQTREGKEYVYFTYEKTVSGKDFFYLATTHKADDAFWLIQFACLKSDKDSMTGTFLGWADSVTFTSSATV